MDMAVAMDGVIGAAVVIITVGAEAEAITMAGGTITTGKRHQCPKIGVGDLRLNTECQFQFINHEAPLGTWTSFRIRPNLSSFGRSKN